MENVYQYGAIHMFTDFSYFEATFVKMFQESVEMVLYEFMVQLLEAGPEWFEVVLKAQTGVNVCCFKDFIIWVIATRMSGEMCTSLGNGFANLMVNKYLCKQLKWRSFKAAVEGDDGCFSFFGKPPSQEDYAQFGMVIKMMVTDDITAGAFCGVICDPEDYINVTDPINALLKFGWTSRQYTFAKHRKLMELLRAKALSMLYQYTGCPILYALARYAERMTAGYHWRLPSSSNVFEFQRMKEIVEKFNSGLPFVETGFRTRLLVERKYGIPIEHQFTIEDYFNQKQELGEIMCPLILRYCPKDAIDYVNRYAFPIVNGFGSVIGSSYQRTNKINSILLFDAKK